jgi:hypothetical protein
MINDPQQSSSEILNCGLNRNKDGMVMKIDREKQEVMIRDYIYSINMKRIGNPSLFFSATTSELNQIIAVI